MTARVWTGVALLWVVLFAYSLTLPAAEASQPYGGCDEAWQAPHSAGAEQCRSHGWTVRPRLVVGPHGYVQASRLPTCSVEDASYGPVPCSWNFGGRGGDAYYATPAHGDHVRFHAVKVR